MFALGSLQLGYAEGKICVGQNHQYANNERVYMISEQIHCQC